MQPFPVKLIGCFKAAEAVVSAYWEHLAASDGGRAVRMENLVRSVALVTDTKIELREVKGTREGFVRGNIERYQDRVVITVKAEQDLKWKRATVAKELSHAIIDGDPEDFCPDAVRIIRQLVKTNDAGFTLDSYSAELRSEHLAEMIALELLYPLEFHEGDAKALKDGKTKIADLSDEYLIPRSWVERGLDEAYGKARKGAWALVKNPEFERLMDGMELVLGNEEPKGGAGDKGQGAPS